MAKLRRKVEDVESEGGAVVQIPEVVVMGELSAEGIKRRLEEVCGAKGLKSVDCTFPIFRRILIHTRAFVERPDDGIANVRLVDDVAWPAAEDEYYIATTHRPTLPTNSEERATALSEAGTFVQQIRETKNVLTSPDTILNDIFTIQPNPSILIYITTPPEDVQSPHPYEMDEPYPSALHVDLKRDLHQKHRRQADDDLNMQSGLGLFEKYQFFTPGKFSPAASLQVASVVLILDGLGLFMGLGVSLLLLMLLYVGIGAISGLEVSYAAFSKEMVQSAQKGKMQ